MVIVKSKLKNKISEHWYVLIFFILLVIAFFPEIFFQGKVLIPPTGDMHQVNYSWVAYFKESFQNGVIPLWNSRSFAGYPYGAGAVSNFNLMNLLVMFGAGLNFTWNFFTLSNVLFAAFFTYLYMKQIGYKPFGSLIAGIIYAFCPSSGCFIDSWGAFLPLVLWLGERHHSSKQIRYLIFLFLSFCTLILNALPQYSFYIGLFFIVYCLVRFKTLNPIIPMVFAIGAVSFYTFRLFELLQQSARGSLWFVNVLLPVHLLNTIFPFFFESPFRPETSFFFSKIFYELTRILFHTDKIQYLFPPYISILGLMFLIIGWNRDPFSGFYRNTILTIVLYMMTFPILAPLYRMIPVLAQLPRIERLETVFTFALAVLTGIGAHYFSIQKINLKPMTKFYLSLSTICVGSLVILRAVVHFNKEAIKQLCEAFIKKNIVGSVHYSAPPEFYLNKRLGDFFLFIHQWTNVLNPSIFISIIIILLSLGTLHLWQKNQARKTLWSIVCLTFIFLDIVIYFRIAGFNAATPEQLRTNSDVIDFLKQDKEIFRVMPILENSGFGDARTRDILSPNLNLLYGLDGVEGYDPVLPSRYSAFFKSFQTFYDKDPAMVFAGAEGNFSYRVADLLNVKYFLTRKNVNLQSKFPVVYEDSNHKVYKNSNYYLRAFIVHNYKVLKTDTEILAEMNSKDAHFDQTVILESEPAQEPPKKFTAGKDSVRINLYSPHEIEMAVELKKSGFIILSDNYYPGWKVRLDGKQEPILKANYSFRAVAVPSGQHLIKFWYDPLSFKLGLLISFLSISIFSLIILKK